MKKREFASLALFQGSKYWTSQDYYNYYIQIIMNTARLLPPPDPHHTNTDLRLINKCLSTEHFDPPFRPRNLNELSKVLSNRLSQKSVSSHEWLARKDFDIRPMLDSIKEHKKSKEEGGIIETAFTKVTYPTIINQEEYLKLSLDSSLNSMLHHAATSRTIRRHIFSTMMGRLNCFQLDRKKRSERYGQLGVPSAPRNFQKRKKYLDLTVDMLQRETVEGGCEGRLWALTYSHGTDHPIWKVLFSQVRNLTFQKSAEPQEAVMEFLLINSLLALQKDFDDELPRSNDGLAAYLQQKYLCKLEPGDFLLDSQFGCLWGKVFLLFRAGRDKELTKILRAYDMGVLAERIQQSSSRIENYRPERWQGEIIGERDVFREQLLFALAGERKFSTPVLSELNSLDSVWILLRNCGIFYRRDSAAFLEIRQQMIDYYMQNSSAADAALPLAYLLSYDTLFLMGIHQLVDKDDYLHLLVAFSKLHPCLCPDRAMLNAKLTQSLLHYLQQLVREEHPQPLLENYLVLFPHQVLLEQASSLITSNKIYSKIRWEVLRDLLPKRFIQLLRVTTERYVEQSGDFLGGAQNLMAWMGKQQQMRLQDISAGIDMLLVMLIRNCNNLRTYDAAEVKQALNLIRNWMSLDSELTRTYHYLLEMFENERQLSQSLLLRSYGQLRNFLESRRETLFFSTIDDMRGRMFQKLAQLQGITVFYGFLRKVLRAADLVFTQEGPESRSRDIRFEIHKMCKMIQQHERFGNIANQQSLEALIFSLEHEIKTGCSLFE